MLEILLNQDKIKRKILKKIKIKIFKFLGYIFLIFCFNFNILPVVASEQQYDQLLKKISIDYTKKFCNGIGFGLAKESAMKFALKENNSLFKNKKGIENLNEELIATRIANSVADGCGYKIGLIDDDGIKQFENDYTEMKKLTLEVN